jgi:predicted ATP-grasp superfamily ATP-dependent carboligase
MVSSLWVAVPHPDADILAREKGLAISNTFESFLKRNDKYRQKELLGSQTPTWKKISSAELRSALSAVKGQWYLKRRLGSGGFTVFLVKDVAADEKLEDLLKADDNDWFLEKEVLGVSCSIQCVKYRRSDDVTIFGFSEQIIDSGRFFAGSKIKPLSSLPETCYRQLKAALKKLSPLLKGYEGFFGLDFIISKNNKVSVLEANIRLTAATIPTLLINVSGGGEAVYKEDVHGQAEEGDIRITVDDAGGTADTVKLMPRKGFLGK